jgi:hypothetical protein
MQFSLPLPEYYGATSTIMHAVTEFKVQHFTATVNKHPPANTWKKDG